MTTASGWGHQREGREKPGKESAGPGRLERNISLMGEMGDPKAGKKGTYWADMWTLGSANANCYRIGLYIHIATHSVFFKNMKVYLDRSNGRPHIAKTYFRRPACGKGHM